MMHPPWICWLRGKIRRLHGGRWDGHCWDGVEGEWAVEMYRLRKGGTAI
jgi:hypothetical protein